MEALAIWAAGIDPSYLDLFEEEDDAAADNDEDAAGEVAS